MAQCDIAQNSTASEVNGEQKVALITGITGQVCIKFSLSLFQTASLWSVNHLIKYGDFIC